MLAQVATARASNDYQYQFPGEDPGASFLELDANGIVTGVTDYADDNRWADGFNDNSMRPERSSTLIVLHQRCWPDVHAGR